MKEFGLSKRERIKSKKEFSLVYNEGKSLFSKSHNLKAIYYTIENSEFPVLKTGFAVHRKAGKAFWRNRVKRLLRESFRLNKQILLEDFSDKKLNLSIIFLAHRVNQKKNKKLDLDLIMPEVVDLMSKIKNRL